MHTWGGKTNKTKCFCVIIILLDKFAERVTVLGFSLFALKLADLAAPLKGRVVRILRGILLCFIR